MLKTKQFANLCSTTKRTIIYYDEIGLLKPFARMDNDYRFYKKDQVLDYQKIYLLKNFGMSLAEIKKYLKGDKKLLDLFLESKNNLQAEIEKKEKRIKRLSEYINNLKAGRPMVTPIVKEVAPYWIYGKKVICRYVDIAKHQFEVFEAIDDKNFKNAGATIFLEDYYKPDKAEIITGAVVKNSKPDQVDGIDLIRVPKYKAISYTHIGSYKYLSYIWKLLENYVKEKGLRRHAKLYCREFYLRGGLVEKDEENLITELQVPIKSSI